MNIKPFYRLLLLLCALLPSTHVLANDANTAKAQADLALKLWTETCLDYTANYRELTIWARANNLRRLNSSFSKEVLQGEKGEVWRSSHKKNNFLLVLTKPNTCAVWAPRADANQINAVFEGLMKDMKNKPELEGDKTVDGKGGEYRQIAYFTHNDDSPYGWVYIATTSSSDTADIQARLTMTRAME